MLPFLQKCQQLDFLYLYDSAIGDAGMKELDAALPGCTIGTEPPV